MIVVIKYFIATISSMAVSFPPTIILGKQWHQLVVKSHNQDTLGGGKTLSDRIPLLISYPLSNLLQLSLEATDCGIVKTPTSVPLEMNKLTNS